METGVSVTSISAIVKLAVDALKLVWPTASSATIVVVATLLSLLLTSLSVLQQTPIIDPASLYAILTQSIISFAVAIGLTEVQKKAEQKRTDAGEPERKIG